MFSKRPKTVLEVIEKELARIHKELNSFSEAALNDNNNYRAYIELVSKLDKLYAMLNKVEITTDEFE